MFNPYTIILGLFVLAGLLATLWGWWIIRNARKTQHWPAVEGVIEESGVDQQELLPRIRYRYTVEQQTYNQLMKFSGDITPTQEFAAHYAEKFPVGRQVQVYYKPGQPDIATLEPGAGKGDWLVLAIGLAMLGFGILFLLMGV
ncbi:MAG: DUF3592 domain-containing protein [Gammaproteobacteria bacterium]|jgi:hypothetical protein